jgi:hypothetical protein
MMSGWKRLSAWMNVRPHASKPSVPVEKSRAGRRLSTGRSAKPTERTARNSPVARSYTCRSGDKGHLKHPSASSFSWREIQTAALSGTSSPLASATRATHRPAASTSAPTSACTVAIPSHTLPPADLRATFAPQLGGSALSNSPPSAVFRARPATSRRFPHLRPQPEPRSSAPSAPVQGAPAMPGRGSEAGRIPVMKSPAEREQRTSRNVLLPPPPIPVRHPARLFRSDER